MQLFQLQPVLGIFFIGGILGLITTLFWIWMIIDCIGNRWLTGTTKIVWLLVVIFTHIIGAILYFLLARGGGSRPVV